MAYNLGFIVISNLRNMLQLFFLKCWNLISAMELWLVDHSNLTKKQQFSNNLTNLDNMESIIQPCTHDQLIKIAAEAALHHPDVLHNVLAISTCSSTSGKLFIGRLGYDITSEMLHHYFSEYGEIEDAFVALDKTTGLSKGYGFVIFKNIHSALLALRQPYKKINGKSVVIRPYRPGITSTTQNSSVLSLRTRQVFVSNVPEDMSPHRLFKYFSLYGEIEKGPIGFEKTTGKFKGLAIFVYKTEEGAKAAISDPSKTIDGYHLTCRMAEDGSNFFKKQPSVLPPSASILGHWICGLGGHQSLNPPICFNHSCGCGAGPGFSSARPQHCSSSFCPNLGGLSSYGSNINVHGCGYTASCCVPPKSNTVGLCNECVDPSSSSSCWLSNYPRHNQQAGFTPLTGVHDHMRTYHSFFSC